jgi:hypothetical protein
MQHSQALLQANETIRLNKTALEKRIQQRKVLRNLHSQNSDYRVKVNVFKRRKPQAQKQQELVKSVAPKPEEIQLLLDSLSDRISTLQAQSLIQQLANNTFLALHSTVSIRKTELDCRVAKISDWKAESRSKIKVLSTSFENLQLQLIVRNQARDRFILKYCPVILDCPVALRTLESSVSLDVEAKDISPRGSQSLFEETTPDTETKPVHNNNGIQFFFILVRDLKLIIHRQHCCPY